MIKYAVVQAANLLMASQLLNQHQLYGTYGQEIVRAQALRFPVSSWTEDEARKWIKKYGLIPSPGPGIMAYNMKKKVNLKKNLMQSI